MAEAENLLLTRSMKLVLLLGSKSGSKIIFWITSNLFLFDNSASLFFAWHKLHSMAKQTPSFLEKPSLPKLMFNKPEMQNC